MKNFIWNASPILISMSQNFSNNIRLPIFMKYILLPLSDEPKELYKASSYSYYIMRKRIAWFGMSEARHHFC
jgi:hypothetical protein